MINKKNSIVVFAIALSACATAYEPVSLGNNRYTIKAAGLGDLDTPWMQNASKACGGKKFKVITQTHNGDSGLSGVIECAKK